MDRKFKTVVISGSMRFWDDIQQAASDEQLKGHIVLMPWKHPDEIPLTPEYKQLYKEMHDQKIEMADEMLVVNTNGYIGNSVKHEIEYATTIGLPIRYTDPL